MNKVVRLIALCAFVAVAASAQPKDPQRLRQFLQAMPKGGDLHNHLSGSVYAESYIRYAANDNLCIDTAKLTIAQCGGPGSVPAGTLLEPYSSTYGQMLDALSMRQFRPTLESGHDHFFNTFGKFSAVSRTHVPEMLTEVVSRMARDNVDYIETIIAPDFGRARELIPLIHPGQSYAQMRATIMASGQVPPIVAAARRVLDDAESQMRKSLGCGTPDAQPGCQLTVRYIYELHRGVPLEQLFCEMVVGYELASADPRMVAVNPVMPEDSYVSMHDFDAQMQMFAFFKPLYPKVHLSMHAGELTLGIVPPEGLRRHIRDSVMIAGAERIGHGVDIAYEDDAPQLMKTMASRGVAVEICLTSNDVILGVSGREHPLHWYIQHGVPVALATDDPGVSRDDMTNQYMRAVVDQHLDYIALERLARNSLEYSFAEGASLWHGRGYTSMNAACADDMESPKCTAFLDANTKARIEMRLERKLRAFRAANRAQE